MTQILNKENAVKPLKTMKSMACPLLQ